MVTDPISNMLIVIKNASRAKKPIASFPHSKMKQSILDCLAKQGFIKSVTKKSQKGFPVLEIELLYENNTPRIHDLKRISKSSLRVYKNIKELRPVRQGFGATVLSTPKGILTDKEAKKEHVGGEALFEIW